jgi:hypothetical protein
MIRTVVYRSRAAAPSEVVVEESPVYGAGRARTTKPPEPVVPDNVLARIIKYIPGETLSIILPATLIGGLSKPWVTAIALVGAAGTPLWLWHRARREVSRTGQLPPPRFYVVAVLAYAAWILASSSPVRTVVGMRQTTAAAVVFLAAYLLPLIDNALDRPG